jgi:hypothetical protein
MSRATVVSECGATYLAPIDANQIQSLLEAVIDARHEAAPDQSHNAHIVGAVAPCGDRMRMVRDQVVYAAHG